MRDKEGGEGERGRDKEGREGERIRDKEGGEGERAETISERGSDGERKEREAG